VIAFVYKSCHDAEGCPAALAFLQELDRRLAGDPAVAARVRLESVSFDPAHDTPEKLAELRELMAPRGDWRFLVPASSADLGALLRDFGQDVAVLEGGAQRHVVKIFLVDDRLQVRNVYSSGFLDADLVLADVATVTSFAGRE
jgi:cytochrome oxidase Cu insertion factor (SCO1/SenC/PrrC family)